MKLYTLQIYSIEHPSIHVLLYAYSKI